jgi:hypothetical protein
MYSAPEVDKARESCRRGFQETGSPFIISSYAPRRSITRPMHVNPAPQFVGVESVVVVFNADVIGNW